MHSTIDDFTSTNVHQVEDWARGWVLGDEWLNGLTHGFGLFLSLLGIFFLVMPALDSNEPWKLFSFTVYGLSLILLYAASTVYHTLKQPKYKKRFRTIDHCAIYLLIAGSYTPFTLVPLLGSIGWLLFGVIWSLACVGIFLKCCFLHRFQRFSTALYLLMGWLVIIAVEPLMNTFPYEGLLWLLMGGLSYTFGVLFFVTDKRKYHHAIWHLFVLGGSACHYVAIALYI